MCVFSAVIKPALGNIIRKGGMMTEERFTTLIILVVIFVNALIISRGRK